MDLSSTSPFIHKLADVQTDNVGVKTRIWQFSVVMSGAIIGSNVNICSHCFIEDDVTIGDNVTIKNGVCLFRGTTIEDNVFIGSNVTFTNDKWPRSKVYPANYLRTVVRKGATIGSGTVILPGLTIGPFAMIGAGTVVTRDVAANAVVYGIAGREKARTSSDRI